MAVNEQTRKSDCKAHQRRGIENAEAEAGIVHSRLVRGYPARSALAHVSSQA